MSDVFLSLVIVLRLTIWEDHSGAKEIVAQIEIQDNQ